MDWKKQLESWRTSYPNSRAFAVIHPTQHSKCHQLSIVNELGKSVTADLPAEDRNAALQACAALGLAASDLVALGVPPAGPPGPGPGPVGDDTILAARLQVIAAISVLAHLLAVREAAREAGLEKMGY